MTGKWQEVEFRDYKQRLVKRRESSESAGRTRRLRADRIKYGFRAAGFLAVLLMVAGLATQLIRARLGRLQEARRASQSRITVSHISGEVLDQTSTGPKPAKMGEVFTGSRTFLTSDPGRLELSPSIPSCRAIWLPGSRARIDPVEVDADREDAVNLTFELESGSLLFKLQAGSPLVEVRLPLGISAFGGKGTYRIDLKENEATISVQGGNVVVKVSGKDGDRTRVGSGERLKFKQDETLGASQTYMFPAETFR